MTHRADISDIHNEAMAVELAALGRRDQAERGRAPVGRGGPRIPADMTDRDDAQAALLFAAAARLKWLADQMQKKMERAA